MQTTSFFAVNNTTGAVLPAAVVSVFKAGTETLATLLTAAGAPLANPFTADATGLATFQAADGLYDVSISLGAYTAPKIASLPVYDVSQRLAAAQNLADLASPAAALANLGGAADDFGNVPSSAFPAWYDATNDVLKARALSSYANDDAPAMNAALAVHSAVCLRPAVGGLTLNTSVLAPLPNTQLKMLGGPQAIPWVRAQTHIGSTLIVGSEQVAAGSINIEDIWFVHPDRLGWYTSNPEGTALPGLLTNKQAHLEVHGAQSGTIRVGGYGCVYGVALYGCVCVTIENNFWYGGFWDPLYAACQEGVAQVYLENSAAWGDCSTIKIRNCSLYGGNSTSVRAVTSGTKTVHVTQRCGPQFGVLAGACEDLIISANFLAGFSHSCIGIYPQSAASASNYLANVIVSDSWIDESNESGLTTLVLTSGFGVPFQLNIHDCYFNGQEIGLRAINITSANGAFSVVRLKIHNVSTTAHIGGAVIIDGADGGDIRTCRIAGYNQAAVDYTASGDNSGSGLILAGPTRNLSVGDVIYGGGINGDVETRSVDPTSGLTPNGTQLGLLDATTNQGNTYFRQRMLQPGLANSAVVTGGTLDNAA